jgi:histidinol-phosphate aminotransferase
MAENPFPSTEMAERATGLRFRERLSTNENEFGPAPGTVAAIARAAGHAHRYADCDHFSLRLRLGTLLAVPPETIRIGSGIDGLIGEISRAFLGPGRTAVASEATYPTFSYCALASGCDMRTVPLTGGTQARADPVALASVAAPGPGQHAPADVVYIAEPDNPTGALLGRSSILALADSLPGTTLLVVDGAYTEYIDQRESLTVREVLAHRMLWLRTFSKAYGLAGMRIGYVVGQPDLLDRLAVGAEHYVVGRLADAAALAALDCAGHTEEVVKRTAAGREHYISALAAMGLAVLPSATNFVTVRCGGPEAAAGLADGLARDGVLVRHLSAAGLTDCLRITIGPTPQREAVLTAIAALLGAPAPLTPALPP